MDCSICSSLPVILRPPRNTICGSCYDGAKCLINLINKLQSDKPANKAKNNWNSKINNNGFLRLFDLLLQTLMNASKWIIDLKNREEELEEKIVYLGEFSAAFRHRIHTDIELKSGFAASPSVSAHRALLATRSEIFKNLLESDGCKAAPMEAITLPELSHEEVESLLEFLYGGDLAEEKLEKHVYSLALAADKYDIPYLQKFCKRYMLRSMNCDNALDVLEIAEVCSCRALKENALDFIVRNMDEIVFSSGFEAFALKNPHLSVQVTRASLMDAKKNRPNSA
ncbi:BTB/POZ domain-containing protein At3g56230 isoform X2 [Cucurbita pepo subsp. pepo]|uniref:BTB/POZ domain-containing protein At3g56230 isoform X2 n=1 Tax=Cucurbita pepo subsp. pepo TaxID=3664 RepID=UPI000C9D40AF|nr:BTB/POZ domain-containing protein At3g56230 isoform X2 [Cucurbita pepo subsp. pepo]